MPDLGRVGSLTFAIAFPSISSGSADLVASNVIDHFAGILGGYSTFCPTSGMGRMDRFGIDNSDHGERCPDMRDAQDVS